MDDDSARMRQTQHNQILRLQEQIALPGHRGRHAAACLAHLVKPGRSLLPLEALDALLTTLQQSKSPLAKQRATRELAKLAGEADSADLSNRIVPALIAMLLPPKGQQADVRLSRHIYLALRIIGTPDALTAVDTYLEDLIEEKQRLRAIRQSR